MNDTTHPMTGLRRVILDALYGIPATPEFFPALEALIEQGALRCEDSYFAWGDSGVDLLSTDDLMALYDTLRPGVLESMGKGE